MTPGARLKLLGAKILTTFYRRMTLMTYRLADREIPVYAAQIDLKYRLLEPADAPAYLALRPDQNQSVYERRLQKGNKCYSAWHDGALVDVCWAASGAVFIEYIDRDLVLDDGDIYSFDAFTAADYRGRGVYMARNSWQARVNQSEGFKRSIALVPHENRSVRSMLLRSGLTPSGTIHYIRLPGMGIRWQTR